MKRFILIALVMLSISASAQVSMTVQLPPSGVLQKAQLWNIVLVSTALKPVTVYIAVRVTDAQTNQPILTGLTNGIPLTQMGAKQLSVKDVSPVRYEYLSPTADRSDNGMLTAGNYLACYALMMSPEGGESVIAEDCIPFTVEPVSPPILNTPANESTVEENLPQFSWLPPAPISLFTNLNYDFTIVELRHGQSAAEAIQQNIPVYHSTRNKNQYLNYPVSAVALDTAKTYAWNVIANNGNTFAAQTEVWTFRVKGVHVDKTTPIEVANVQLKRGLDAPLISCSGALQLGYTNEAADKTVNYEIVSLDAKSTVVQSGTLTLDRGLNQLLVVLEGKGFSNGQPYLFHLKNGRNEYWNAKFIYNKK